MIRLALAAPLVVAAAWASADMQYEPHERIASVVRAFAQAQAAPLAGEVDIEIGSIDSRLRLAACSERPQASLSNGSRIIGNATVAVSCAGPRPWSLLVPIEVVQHREVVIVNRSIPRGTLLTADMLTLAPREIRPDRTGYFTDPERAVGMLAKRAIGADTALTAQIVEPPNLVARGDRVVIGAITESIQIRVAGEALRDGRAGERIQVRNLSSKRIVEGIVVAHGVVQITGVQ